MVGNDGEPTAACQCALHPGFEATFLLAFLHSSLQPLPAPQAYCWGRIIETTAMTFPEPPPHAGYCPVTLLCQGFPLQSSCCTFCTFSASWLSPLAFPAPASPQSKARGLTEHPVALCPTPSYVSPTHVFVFICVVSRMSIDAKRVGQA